MSTPESSQSESQIKLPQVRVESCLSANFLLDCCRLTCHAHSLETLLQTAGSRQPVLRPSTQVVSALTKTVNLIKHLYQMFIYMDTPG